jgi:hypothetical protein
LGVGNLILGMGFNVLFLHYFIVLFSVSCFGNLLGLNISSGMKTRVAVFILIPFLIIPQIMLSGVLVKFEELSPLMGSQSSVPLVGNVMVSRWAYEGLATDQFKNNDYEQAYFNIEKQKENAAYRQDWWYEKLDNQYNKAKDLLDSGRAANDALIKLDAFFKSEFTGLKEEYPMIHFTDMANMDLATSKQSFLTSCKTNMDSIKKYFARVYDKATVTKEHLDHYLINRFGSVEELKNFENTNSNKRLRDIVTNNTDEKEKAVLTQDGIIRKFEPVYIEWKGRGLFSAPF